MEFGGGVGEANDLRRERGAAGVGGEGRGERGEEKLAAGGAIHGAFLFIMAKRAMARPRGVFGPMAGIRGEVGAGE